MSEKTNVKSEWLCISCGHVLGRVLGSELHPQVPGENLRTSGPNLEVTCPECGSRKVWFTADRVVRAIYQLVDAIADVAARAMVEQIGRAMHTKDVKQ